MPIGRFAPSPSAGLPVGNLMPAFPGDGGRLVRARWSMRHGREEATRRATRLGRWVAVGLMIAPFVLAVVTKLPAPVLIVLPLLGAVVFILGEWERLKEFARARATGTGFGFRPGSGPGPGPGPDRGPAAPLPPQDGVVEATGSSRVVDERGP